MKSKKSLLSLLMALSIVANMAAMDPVSASGFFGQANPSTSQRTVTIQTNDDQEFNVPLELAKQIPVINKMLEDIGEELATAIPLPTVDAPAFDWILQTLQMLQNNPDAQISTKEYKNDQLINFANACEYLELEQIQTQLFEALNERKLSEASLKTMNDTVLKKFWQQYPAYFYFLASADEELTTQSKHFLISPDGRLISWVKKTIFVTNLHTGDQLVPALQHQAKVDKVVISSDGSKLVSLSQDMGITVWNSHTGEQIFPTFFQDDIAGAAISPRGNILISWSLPVGLVFIRDLNTGNQILPLPLHETIRGAAINPDETKLIVWRGHNKIGILDLHTGEQILPDLLHQNVRGVIVSPDGNKLISWAELNSPAKIWNLHTGKQILPELDGWVYTMIINSDGSKLFSAGFSNIRIWNMNNLRQKPQKLPHKNVSGLAISPDDRTLISWSENKGTIKIWDLNRLNELNNLTADQIQFMLWLVRLIIWMGEHPIATVYQIFTESGSAFKISPTLKAAYESLPNNLKNILQKKFPIIDDILKQSQAPQPSLWQRFLQMRRWTS